MPVLYSLAAICRSHLSLCRCSVRFDISTRGESACDQIHFAEADRRRIITDVDSRLLLAALRSQISDPELHQGLLLFICSERESGHNLQSRQKPVKSVGVDPVSS